MPSQIEIFVNGWAVSLNRTPNVTMLQTYTPAAELSDTGDFVTEFSEQNHEPLDETRRGSSPRRAQIALTQAVETKDDFNEFKNFRDSEFVCLLQLRGSVVRPRFVRLVSSECQLFDMSCI
jgi:hypothetical protein